MIFPQNKTGYATWPSGMSGSLWCEPGFETPAAQIPYRFMPKKKKVNQTGDDRYYSQYYSHMYIMLN